MPSGEIPGSLAGFDQRLTLQSAFSKFTLSPECAGLFFKHPTSSSSTQSVLCLASNLNDYPAQGTIQIGF